MRLAILALVIACTGCSTIKPSTAVVQPVSDWRTVATDADRARLRDWRGAFQKGLASARATGHAAEIASQGALLDPDSAIGGAIAIGLYRCRIIKLGGKSPEPAYFADPWSTCRVQQQGKLQRFARLNGPQRQIGVIFPNDQIRSVFLGTLTLPDERRAMAYGVDARRDVIGFVERIGPQRWRLVMPSPAFGSQVDVMDLIPQS